MHRNRLIVLLAFLSVLLPLWASGSGLRGQLLRASSSPKREELFRMLEAAQERYQERAGISARQSTLRRKVSETEEKLVKVGREKRELRLHLSSLRAALRGVEGRLDGARAVERDSADTLAREQERLLSFLHLSQAKESDGTLSSLSTARGALLHLFLTSMGSRLEENQAAKALLHARRELLASLDRAKREAREAVSRLQASGGDIERELPPLERELGMLQSSYRELLQKRDEEERTRALTEEELLAVKQEVAGVQSQVLSLQAELSAIDARIRQRAEEQLVHKGLRSQRDGADAAANEGGVPLFSWPVYGSVSAGFYDSAYEARFGVPHKGMDIVVPPGTPVASAADGIAFLARDGGEYGYSYLLVGHRGGYATLYGHLSAFAVSAGQDIRRGQIIGISGGERGSHGAGPMTTGPHLHFEVINNGSHVNPMSVLP